MWIFKKLHFYGIKILKNKLDGENVLLYMREILFFNIQRLLNYQQYKKQPTKIC